MNINTRDAPLAPLAPIKEGRPVKMFTDNSAETIVFGNTEMSNHSLDVA